MDPLSARSRLAGILSNVSLHPASLPSSAVVCIRRLQDPRPGTLRLGDLRPPRVWEEAVTSSIDRLSRRAARPALGPVPADAEAVLFMDRSELLACLARDWSQGMINQWWWKSLFRNPVTAGRLMRELLEAPEYVPGALRILAGQGKAASTAAELSENEATALVRAITQKFGLVNVQTALDGLLINEVKDIPPSSEGEEEKVPSLSSDVEETNGLPADDDVQNDPQLLNSAGSPGKRRVPAPWLRFVPESAAPALGPEHQTLLGIGLMLTRAPAEIRKSSFAESISDWKAGLKAENPLDPTPQANTGTEEIKSKTETSGHRHSVSDRKDGSSSAWPLESRFRGNDELTGRHPEMHMVSEDTASSAIAPVTGHLQSTHEPLAIESEHAGFHAIETGLGGLFYLINLGLFLGLYGDFTTPRSPGIELDIWDFVTILGKRFLSKEMPDDPAWPLLATLAGRHEPEAAGRGFEPANEWRLPAAWLETFREESAWQWNVGAGRLKVIHPAGFTILDIPASSQNPGEQLERETREYRSAAQFILQNGPIAEEKKFRPPLERWLDCLVPYIQARLIRALGLSTTERLSEVLLKHSANVKVAEAHLDVHYRLDGLPLDVRIAGLDRDPGWVPAARRYVRFHYD